MRNPHILMRNILFDLYGTLIDLHTNETKATLWRSMAGIYSMQGAVYDAGELKRRYISLCGAEAARLLPIVRKKYQSDEISSDDIEIDLGRVFGALYTEKGVKTDKRLIEFTAAAFRSISMSYITLFDGVYELLDKLHKERRGVYLISNAQALFTKPEMISLGLYDKFDGIIYSSDVQVKKPSPYIFRRAMEEFKLDPADCVMVGNDPISDIRGAHSVGLKSIYVRTGQEGIASEAKIADLPTDCVSIERISEVWDIVRGYRHRRHCQFRI